MLFRVWGLGLYGAVQGLHGISDTTLITKNQRKKKMEQGNENWAYLGGL